MEAALNGPSGRTTLGPTVLSIGRLATNALVVNDPKASSRHAEISPAGSGYSITDVGSTNGTFVNEQRLDRNVPRVLNPGDRIRIGDTVFTYEGAAASPQAPTLYAGAEGGSPGYQPTVAAPSPYTDYNVGQAYQAPQAYPDYQSPPAAYPSYGPPPQPAYGAPGYFAAPGAPAAPAAPKTNRNLIIGLGAGGVVVVVVVLILLFTVFLASSPSKTLTSYCNDLKSGDYQAAYGLLSTSVTSRVTEPDFAAIEQQSINAAGGISSCSVNISSQNSTSAVGTITYFTNDGRSVPTNYALVNESGGWKITREG